MALATIFRGLQLTKSLILPAQYTIQKCDYAVAPKRRRAMEKVVIAVETDPHKLVNYCCGLNYFTEGEEVKLKPDSEYPDWLWDLKLDLRKISELDPNSKHYWRVMRRLNIRKERQQNKKKK